MGEIARSYDLEMRSLLSFFGLLLSNVACALVSQFTGNMAQTPIGSEAARRNLVRR
jgi:hypothetical protein